MVFCVLWIVLLIVGLVVTFQLLQDSRRYLKWYVLGTTADLLVMLLLMKFYPAMVSVEHFLINQLKQFINTQSPEILQRLSSIKTSFDFTGYILAIFGIATTFLSLLGTRQSANRNPYILIRRMQFPVFYILMIVLFQLSIYCKVGSLILLQCCIFAAQFCICIGFGVGYFLSFNEGYLEKRLVLKLKALILAPHALSSDTQKTGTKLSLKRVGCDNFEQCLKIMGEVRQWSMKLLADHISQESGLSEQAAYLVRIIQESFFSMKQEESKWKLVKRFRVRYPKRATHSKRKGVELEKDYSVECKMCGGLIPFCVGYAIMATGPELNIDKIRMRFCALLHGVASLTWEDEKIEEAFLEGLVVARQEAELMMLYKKGDFGRLYSDLRRIEKNIYQDCIVYSPERGEKKEKYSLGSKIFSSSARLWAGITYDCASWVEEKNFKNIAEYVFKGIERYCEVNDGPYYYENVDRTELGKQVFTVLQQGGYKIPPVEADDVFNKFLSELRIEETVEMVSLYGNDMELISQS